MMEATTTTPKVKSRKKQAAIELLLRRRARRSLIEFCKYVDPNYREAKHLKLLESYLQQVERYIETSGAEGIGRLIINMPPRHGKSQTISKRLPAFILGRHPQWRIGLLAYNDDFAEDFSRANRDLCDTSEEYHTLFPNIKVSDVSSAVGRWSLADKRQDDPSVVAAGINGSITGRGFQLIIIDDPLKNRQEADSAIVRQRLKGAYQSTIRPRLEPSGAIVIVCTRWHEDDPAGWLLELQRIGEGEKWVELNLPAIAETNDPLGRQVGEALWAWRYPLGELEKLRAALSDYEWFALYCGRPTAPGGTIFKREWWKERNRFDAKDLGLVNSCVARWVSFDTGLKDKEDDAYTACTIGELTPDYRLMTREVWRERLTFPDLPAKITEFAKRYNRDGKLRGIIIEDKASGTSAYQTLLATLDDSLRGLLIAFQPSGSKEQRGSQAAVWCRNGCVWLPLPSDRVPWLADFENEMFSFPSSVFKDMTDSFSQLILYVEHLLEEGYRARNYT